MFKTNIFRVKQFLKNFKVPRSFSKAHKKSLRKLLKSFLVKNLNELLRNLKTFLRMLEKILTIFFFNSLSDLKKFFENFEKFSMEI